MRAVVVDEVHAFAGDDRGWHLLAVLERLARLAGRPIQRVGLSATVGNPDELLDWLQGSGADSAAGRPVVAPDVVAGAGRAAREVTLDYVGSLDNAAKVISPLHRGEKRLVFCESRRGSRSSRARSRERDVTTFVSHSSLSVDERRRAEQAFAEARDCVIVATVTLELGIDVGDLDRVIQIDAPRTVASFLQRLGRTGRRPGTTRNACSSRPTDDGLLQAAGLLLLWSRGYVEPVIAAAEPAPHRRPAAAGALPAGAPGRRQHLDASGGTVSPSSTSTPTRSSTGSSIRPPGVRRRDALHRAARPSAGSAAATSWNSSPSSPTNPEFTVLQGRQELGTVDPIVLTRKVDGPADHRARRRGLAGHLHRLEAPALLRRAVRHRTAKMRWMGDAAPMSFALARAERDVLLGDDPSRHNLQAGDWRARRDPGRPHHRSLAARVRPSPREGRRSLVDMGRCPCQRDLDRRASRTSPMTPSDPTTSESDCAASKQPRSSGLRWSRWCGRTFCRRSPPQRLLA